MPNNGKGHQKQANPRKDKAREIYHHAKKESVEENAKVPVLMYNAGTTSNYVEWKKRISTRAIEVYGYLGKCVRDHEEDYELPEVTDPIDELIINAPVDPLDFMGAFRKQFEINRFLKAEELRNKVISDTNKKKPELFAYIMSTLSKESQSKIEESEDWAAIYEIVDPLSLIRIIVQTHQAPDTECMLKTARQQRNFTPTCCKALAKIRSTLRSGPKPQST